MALNSHLYGKGIFSTVAICGGDPIFWEAHWRRLVKNSVKTDVDLTAFNADFVYAELLSRIDENKLKNGRARLTFYDDGTSQLWPTGEDPTAATRLEILIAEQRSIPDQFGLTISPFPVNSCSPLAGVKSCNYLEPILSIEEAKKRGFHEAIRVNEREHVTSSCMANVFWEKDGEMFTPALSTGCLAGTTREYVIDNVQSREVEAPVEELEKADAIFLTSAGLGIVRVAEYEGRRFSGSQHAIETLWPPPLLPT